MRSNYNLEVLVFDGAANRPVILNSYLKELQLQLPSTGVEFCVRDWGGGRLTFACFCIYFFIYFIFLFLCSVLFTF